MIINTILNQITPDVLTALGVAVAGFLVTIIKKVGDKSIDYLESHRTLIEQNLQISKHQELLQTAKEIWNIVEEEFRITDNIKDLAKSKGDEFNKLLLAKVPGLTQNEITEIRQTLAGEINKGKDVLYKDSLQEQQTKIMQENDRLVTENSQLKNKIEQLQNVIK